MSEKITTRRLSARQKGKTDWKRVEAKGDKALDSAIAADLDANVRDADWTRARLVMPRRKESIHLRLDPDILAWYRQQGHGYLTRMNAVLKAYMDAHRQQ
jgi:uncharacterized protein (DUF4415 family)